MSKPLPRNHRRLAGRINRMLHARTQTLGLEGPGMNSLDPEVREELVSRVRREIQAGTYDTPDKFEAALDRLTDRFDGD